MRDFRKNFVGVHRKLAKAVGFVAPRKGLGTRFVLGDTCSKPSPWPTCLPAPG